MATTHTPGPWYPHYAKADHCLSSSVWGQEPGNQIAVIGGKSLQTMNANATLIAAAPALLEACKRARNYFVYYKDVTGKEGGETIAQLDAAIAQATGR